LTHDYDSVSQFLTEIRLECGLIVILSVGKMGFNWMGVFLWMKFGERQQTRVRKAIYNDIFTTNHEWFESRDNLMGDVSQINRCIEEFRAGTATAIGSLISTVGLIIAMAVTAFVQSWSLTLVILASSPFMLLCGWYFGGITYTSAKSENDCSSKASKCLSWNLSSANIVKLFNGKYAEIANFNNYVTLSMKAFNKMSNAIAANSAILHVLSLFAFIQGFWFGNYMISTGRLTINQMFTCFSCCLLLGTEISLIASVIAYLNKSYAATAKINDFMNDNSKTFIDEKGEYPSPAIGHIEFKNVSFNYASRRDTILKDISFSIHPNEFNYIIGNSGSGKSTITNLILKFYKYEKGQILVDGHDVKNLSHTWLSENITLIQQDPIIFDDSLRNNISIAAMNRLSMNDVPDLLILDACRFALLDTFVNALNKGIYSKVSSKTLSGGQLQRISIARAYVRDTPILILDETFSALDNENKTQIICNLKKWREGKTTIVVTHDFDYIENYDHVIYLQNGIVAETGNFGSIKSNLKLDFNNKTKQPIKSYDTEKEVNYDFLCDPVVLQDLELQIKPESKMTPILTIVKHFIVMNKLNGLLVLGLLASLLSGILSPIFSYFFSKLLSIMVDAATGKNIVKQLTLYASVLIAIVVIHGISIYLSTYLLAYVSESWIVELRKSAFLKFSEQDMTFSNNENEIIGELTALLLNDTRDLRVLAAETVALLLNLVTMLLIGIIWSLVAGWKLALVGISFIPIFLIITFAYSLLLSIFERKYKDGIATLENQNYSSVVGLRSIYNLNVSDYFVQVFQNHLQEVNHIATWRAFATGFGVSLVEVLIAAAFAACIYYGMKLISSGEYSQFQFIQVITILTFTMTNASMLLGHLPNIARGQRAGTYILKQLKLKPSLAETEGNVVPTKINVDPIIQFRNANFTYLFKTEMILKKLSVSINLNEIVALVGKSGSGKSTIASLLFRLYHIQDNSIFINNYDINRLDIDWIRDNISIVPQTAKFFEGSISENLVYGILPQVYIGEDDVKNALQLANMLSFVESLPSGIDTRIGGESMSAFSGGQLQRLAIARALIRKPKILIMDECTSNLDPMNTQLVINLIKSMSGSLTIIMITHDVELMKLASRVIFLNNGAVANEGTFDVLYKQSEHFRTIIEK
jgi:ATP-binding cassette subfamily B (MDR/TAP) protein 1